MVKMVGSPAPVPTGARAGGCKHRREPGGGQTADDLSGSVVTARAGSRRAPRASRKASGRGEARDGSPYATLSVVHRAASPDPLNRGAGARAEPLRSGPRGMRAACSV
ncbi:unnamed protein product [Gadus morhua 'NCC']